MPTKTFFNLPIEKQNALIEASEREFSRVDFAESSINRIIQDVGISRGSFYMYFTGKEDLYFYVLEKYLIEMYQQLLCYLDQYHGDFIMAFMLFHEKLVESCLKRTEGQLIKRMFLNMRFATEKKMILDPSRDIIKMRCQELLNHMDKKLYRYQKEEEFLDSVSLVLLITMSSIVYILMNPEQIEQEKESYNRRLEIVRFGILRREL